MSKFVRAVLWLLVGAVMALLLIECTFQMLPVNKGLVRNLDADWPLHNYEARQSYAYSFGWSLLNAQYGTTNNYGHLVPFDFQPDSRPIAVIGDSYIESKMNPYADTIQGQMGASIGDALPVYGMGAGGLSISDYLVLATRVGRTFRPRALVIALVDGDLSESVIPRRGWNYFDDTTTGGIQSRFVSQLDGARPLWSVWLSYSSLYRYLRGNLALDPMEALRKITDMVNKATPTQMAQTESAPDPKISKAIQYFVDELPVASGVEPDCTVFLLDSDRYRLYGLPTSSPIDNRALREQFVRKARAAGMQVVDLAPLFADDYRTHGLRFDHSPTDRHWNRNGHRVAAEAALAQLQHCKTTKAELSGAMRPGVFNRAKLR
jgi:hypothetical protein